MEFGRPIVYSFAGDSPLDLHALRSRLEAMDTAALVRFGQASAFMCSRKRTWGKSRGRLSWCSFERRGRSGAAG
jgi:hypothetical protein